MDKRQRPFSLKFLRTAMCASASVWAATRATPVLRLPAQAVGATTARWHQKPRQPAPAAQRNTAYGRPGRQPAPAARASPQVGASVVQEQSVEGQQRQVLSVRAYRPGRLLRWSLLWAQPAIVTVGVILSRCCTGGIGAVCGISAPNVTKRCAPQIYHVPVSHTRPTRYSWKARN